MNEQQGSSINRFLSSTPATFVLRSSFSARHDVVSHNKMLSARSALFGWACRKRIHSHKAELNCETNHVPMEEKNSRKKIPRSQADIKLRYQQLWVTRFTFLIDLHFYLWNSVTLADTINPESEIISMNQSTEYFEWVIHNKFIDSLYTLRVPYEKFQLKFPWVNGLSRGWFISFALQACCYIHQINASGVFNNRIHA